MAWPNSTDYFEAIQNPADCFGDPELRQGEPAVNPMGLPILYAGNFAAVFQIIGPNNQRWAVKCFTREVSGLQQRYQAVSAHLQKSKLPFMVEFQYLEQGIKIGDQWYAVLKMRWVEGLALNQLVQESLEKPYVLNRLSKMWIQLAALLRRAGIAHGDLQHGNVLLVPGSKEGNLALKLIDYDGMFVPALARNKPGEKGHPNFQHPQRLKEGTYHGEIDRFSHLLIYCSLRCLAAAGKPLWKPIYDNGENLLFKEEDVREPGKSPLFRELWQLNNPETHALVGRLALACQAPLEKTPLLDELVNGDTVRPLTANEERRVTALLGEAGFKGTNAAAAETSADRQRWSPFASVRRVLLTGIGCLALLAFGLGAWLAWPAPDLPPAQIANYLEHFRNFQPAPGWQYLWNKNGPIGDPANYSPLLPSSAVIPKNVGKRYDTDGQGKLPRPDPGAYLHLGKLNSRPGRGAQQATIDYYAIAAYTIPPAEVPGEFRIAGSGALTAGSIEVLIHINDRPPLLRKIIEKGTQSTFDVELGRLKAGDTVYVGLGPNGDDTDDFVVFNFTIERGPPPK